MLIYSKSNCHQKTQWARLKITLFGKRRRLPVTRQEGSDGEYTIKVCKWSTPLRPLYPPSPLPVFLIVQVAVQVPGPIRTVVKKKSSLVPIGFRAQNLPVCSEFL